MANSSKGKLGLIQIDFIDHMSYTGEGDEPPECQVWGVLVEETDTFYRVMSWNTKDDSEHSEGVVVAKTKDLKIYRFGKVNVK